MGHVHKDKMPLQLKSFMLGHRFSDTPPAIIDSTFFISSVIRKQPDIVGNGTISEMFVTYIYIFICIYIYILYVYIYIHSPGYGDICPIFNFYIYICKTDICIFRKT